jgi:hypothetical protein
MSEVRLPGGQTTGAVLIGDVVHKPAVPSSVTVHALLRHLEGAGFDGAPRALGFDEQGREMLTYLPGDTVGEGTPWPQWVSAESVLVQVGRWLRRLHDATVGFVPPAGERWFIGEAVRPGLIVGHQDAAPYNAVVDGDRWSASATGVRPARRHGSSIWRCRRCGGYRCARRTRSSRWASTTSPAGPAVCICCWTRMGYEADRTAFGAVIVQRARRQAAAIRRMAEEGDQAAARVLFVARYFESAASDVEALPNTFWAR